MGKIPRDHSRIEWEKQRPEITRLYAAEDVPLKDVVEIMQNRHAFCARSENTFLIQVEMTC